MPPLRVTRKTPMHIILIADDSGSMQEDQAFEHANRGIREWLLELQLQSKAQKDHFWTSVIVFGSRVRIEGEALRLHDIDPEFAPIQGRSGSTDMAAALACAREILDRNPPKATDCPPWIFLYTDGQADDEHKALREAKALKETNLACGPPIIVTIGFRDARADFLQQVATRPEYYLPCPDSDQLANMIPEVGTLVVKGTIDEAKQKLKEKSSQAPPPRSPPPHRAEPDDNGFV